MKRMDLLCSSSASTAICSSLDHRSMVHHRYKPVDHHQDQRKGERNVPYSSSPLPINPRPYYEKIRKSNSSKQSELRRKSSADIYDLRYSSKAGGSSRHLLGDSSFIDWSLESESESSERVPALVHLDKPAKPRQLRSLSLSSSSSLGRVVRLDESLPLKSSSSSNHPTSPALRTSSSARSHDQEVNLRVSLHCKGCEGKVRKHISKMEGVRAFTIDFATKKVTVIGDVTPLGVLASVSKVKNAQLWHSPTSSSSLWTA